LFGDFLKRPAGGKRRGFASQLFPAADGDVVMKSAISNRPVRSMSAIGNLWSLSVVGPFIAGSVQMTKLSWSQCLQEILTTLWA
jgi:hypothetical protein